MTVRLPKVWIQGCPVQERPPLYPAEGLAPGRVGSNFGTLMRGRKKRTVFSYSGKMNRMHESPSKHKSSVYP